ncbi:MAG: tRNA 2-thiouridine(34) synthase MnmA [Desulfobacula sp.]|nr:tRNA 2-thiouridine(34) synthase MnmA [Desulfobacula sp.]
MDHQNKVVAVALSGGIDSLVSGYLLKRQYKNIFGIHFTNGYEQENKDLSLIEKQLGFPVACIDLSKEFEQKIVRYFIDTYVNGKTPNPCIRCNKEIKFGILLDHALKMGADYLATGHYASIITRDNNHYLEKGKDPLKDQSYFLSMLSKKQLGKIIFPLAHMEKNDVKKFAVSKKLHSLSNKESQDICFIHDNDFAGFIQKKNNITPEPGDIKDIENKIVGRHQGLHKFTIGQRRGINCPAEEPYYVQHIDMKNNILKVCFKKDLLKRTLSFSDIAWNGSNNLQLSDKKIVIKDIMTKIRYSHRGGVSTLSLNKTCGKLVFDEPQNAITPGQTAVFHKGTRVLGAGIIQ